MVESHTEVSSSPPLGPLRVQKFGGSSVASPEKIRGVAARVARAHHDGSRLVVVVSAMAGRTDALAELGQQVVSRAPNRRELDALLSTGEAVSAALLALALADHGVEAVSLRGWQAGIETHGAHGQARIQSVDTETVRAELDAGRVVVLTGYQGVNADGALTTLGRGGSDYTAVSLAHALCADRCEIYSDVEGVYSADPRIVPSARPIARLGYDEMLEYARQGAKVLNTTAMREARDKGVVVHARSTFGGPRETIVGPLGLSGRVAGVAGRREVYRLTISPEQRDALVSAHELVGERLLESGRLDLVLALSEGTYAEALRKDLQGAVVDGPFCSVSIVGSAAAKAGSQHAARVDSLRRDFVRALADASVAPIDSFRSEYSHTFLVAHGRGPLAVRAVHRRFLEQAQEQRARA